MVKKTLHALKTVSLKRKVELALIAALLCINGALSLYLLNYASGSFPELVTLRSADLDFKSLSKYFTKLANDKGAVYAFEILKRAPMPPNIDVHLLGHIVGDILYKQKGAEGIKYCTRDFRNACSHTIVIGTLLEKGPESFKEIAELCRQAPGGRGAYTMCFHGLGHGVLAYNDYELPAAIKMCETGAGSGRESTECVGGAIMEMVAGVHDVNLWKEKSKKYFKASDPLYPCSANFMADRFKGICYTYITPHLFEAAGGDIGHPKPADFEKAFKFCEPLSGSSRDACFGGIGKEFPTLAQNRDIRAIDQLSDEKFSLVLSWCNLASPQDGKDSCVTSALRSIFWGGENDPLASARFCNVAETKGFGKVCADELIAATGYYIPDLLRQKEICEALSADVYRNNCFRKLLRL